MGPGSPPLVPSYEFLSASEEYRSVTKVFQECNYLQGHEGNLDPVHTSFLHRKLQDDHKGILGSDKTYNLLQTADPAATIDVELTDFGMRIYAVRNAEADKQYLKVTNFIYPNLAAVNADAGRRGEGYLVNWHVPVDDTHHCKYIFIFSRKRPIEKVSDQRSELTSDYRLIRNEANRYLQDRESMKTWSYNGLGLNFQAHDVFATASAGAIQDRSNEHLVSSDKAIVAGRKLLLKAIRDVQEGREAPHVIRDPEFNQFPNLVVMSEVVPSTVDWRDLINKATEAREIP